MARYMARRLIQAIPILIGVSVIVFLIVYASPGDPTDRFRTPRVPPEQIEALIRSYGLDKPLPEQYFAWVTTFFQVWNIEAWGYSFVDGLPVLEKVARRLPPTILLMGTALIVTIIFAIPIGIIAAVRQYSWTDKIITTTATIGYALPSFLLGTYVLYLGGVLVRQWTGGAIGFPLFGMESLGSRGDPVDIAWHMVLPVTSLAILSIAAWSRYTRSSMLDVLHQDYVRTAKAKGLPRRTVLYKHALRNALIPIVTLLGLSIPTLIAGAAITETIFSWPGIGSMFVESVGNKDYPVIMAVAMLSGAAVILGNLLADLLYGFVDPRIKY
ncbi:MAG TPA: ABC transporter permease [Anaerolineae bacterium]|jgi:peptide/nickel transport system permease protein|nr:ABC transporter permease [Anaerolineae bacterium]